MSSDSLARGHQLVVNRHLGGRVEGHIDVLSERNERVDGCSSRPFVDQIPIEIVGVYLDLGGEVLEDRVGFFEILVRCLHYP